MNNRLDGNDVKKILFSNILVRASKIIFHIFLNIFVWKNTHDISLIALFNIVYLTFHLISFSFFAKIIKKGGRNTLHVVSLFGLGLTYSSIIFLGEALIHYILLYGAVFGFFNGIYWIIYHTNQFDLTNFKNRGNYNGIIKSAENISRVIVPSLIGGLISIDLFGYGYESGFVVGIILFLIAAFYGRVKIDYGKVKDYNFYGTFTKLIKNKYVFRSLYTYSFSGFGFSNTLLEIIIPILLFSYVGNEGGLGLLISLFAIFSIVGSYLFGKYVKYKYYRLSILISGILYSFTLIFFVSFFELKYMVILTALLNFLMVFFYIPQKVISSNVLHKIKNYNNVKIEYMVIREIFMYLGRVSGFGLIYFMGSLEVEDVSIIFYFLIILILLATFILSTIRLDKISK